MTEKIFFIKRNGEIIPSEFEVLIITTNGVNNNGYVSSIRHN